MKLYYPEPDSSKIIELVSGKRIAYSQLHELELSNALQLKVFGKTATLRQAAAARSLIKCDAQSGVLTPIGNEWSAAFNEAIVLSEQFSHQFGCRSLDILHCAVAKLLQVAEFVTTDTRQKNLATAMGLNVVS